MKVMVASFVQPRRIEVVRASERLHLVHVI